MKELKVLNHEGTLVVDSREVAEMVGMRHADLLEKISNYKGFLENGKFRFQDFFIPDTYKVEGNNKTYDCYLLTRKGCDMVANKMTGEKGVLFTAAYVDKFYEMESALRQSTVSQALLPDKAKEMRAEAMLYNAKTKQAELWMKLGDMLNTPEHKQLCAAYCSQVLTGGQMVLPLPQVEKTYSAKEVGDMYGISAQMVGRLANQNGLKTSEYGSLRLDKSPYCDKEVETWRYNQKGADAIGRLMQ